MQIPFVNLKFQYEAIRKQTEQIFLSLGDMNLIRGKEVAQFEEAFGTLLTTAHCITTGNGTDALFICLKALGIKPGDEVITPSFSWVSSSETISLCGATPVFVDVDPKSYTLDATLFEEKITRKTKAVVVVHLYGQAAALDEIRLVCKKHNLFLIEDCAQAHLTEFNGMYTGTFGDAAAFSFYPTKNLGAFGDAGCILSNNPDLAEMMRRFANHGALQKDDHQIEGMNSRMDTLQAAILLAKLPYLKSWNMKRRENAALYQALLSDISDVILPYEQPGSKHSYHIFAIRVARRNELKNFLAKQGIQTMIHYPVALPNLQTYRYLNHRTNEFPVATQLQQDILSLPVYPGLTPSEIEFVCEKIRSFCS